MKEIAIVTLFLATIVMALVGASYFLAYRLKPTKSILALALYFWAGTILFFVTTLVYTGQFPRIFKKDWVYAVLGIMKLSAAMFILITTWQDNQLKK